MKTRNFIIKAAKRVMASSLICATAILPSFASSHSEAPLIARDRYADNTDTYAFRSALHSGRPKNS